MSDPVAHLTDFEGASVSALARDEDGAVLASHDPDRALAPASNTKLITSALALDALGPDYRFETRIEGYGSLESDPTAPSGTKRLDGDLVLVGSGQPDLARDGLDELARMVAADFSEIRGDLLLDGSRFGDDQLGPGWTWGDEQYYYGARSSAVALEKNLLTIEISGEKSESGDFEGGVTSDFEVSVTPETEVVTVETDLEVGNEDLQVYTDHETGVVRVEGTLPADADRTERVPVADPERHCGAAFRAALADAGVAVSGELRVVDDSEFAADPEFSASVESAPVSDLLREMNVPSDNFVAEQLARTVASERAGEGSWEGWEEITTDFFETLGVGACRIRDGSGLSRYNVVPARALVGLLEWAREQAWSDDFFDSLPASDEGTLENRLDDVSGVRAKTGTITGTSALSGILRREGDSDVVFSVVFGGLTVEADAARERQDAFVRALR